MLRTWLAGSLLFVSGPLAAQQLQPPPAAEDGDMAAALAAIERMSSRLRSYDRFEVRAQVSTEEVFTDGEKLQFLNEVHYIFERPDHLYANIRSDRSWRRYYYDGEMLTVAAPSARFYATAPVTGTVREVLDRIYRRYGIHIPLEDLFTWGVEGADTVVPSDAFLVGFAQVDEHPTDHFFYRAPGVDFQLWIGREDDLPHRIVITNTADVAQPQYVAALDWNFSPQGSEDRFTFVPDEHYREIPLQPDPAVVAAGGEQ